MIAPIQTLVGASKAFQRTVGGILQSTKKTWMRPVGAGVNIRPNKLLVTHQRSSSNKLLVRHQSRRTDHWEVLSHWEGPVTYVSRN